ncbi:MAG TPA: toll/interleukin-1 receptor domain-containing protein [Steroidobacteraceae bacterium]|nr:toll/interleukin-1 receptor domain-containing protein [Steroidobacteraceae bacterium]
MDSPKYRAFLSYSHRDAKWGAWLHKALESYRPPKPLIGTVTARGPVPKRLAPIFRDREELASATDLGTVIDEALSQSACQIVICSPSSARSKWVNEEILAFKRLGREDRIFCLIVDGEPNASDDPAHAQEECFPQALRYKLAADGELSSVRTEPIAADARPGKDRRNNAKLKLIAGLLGVGFDALRQREQHRRQRQLFAIASGAIAGMVLTSGLATVALIARATAQRQTVIAKREAETARQTTSFLVDLFKISDPSEARGNSLTAREVLDKGAARVETQLARQPQIQATLMDTLGTVYMGLGLYGQAQPLLQSAVAKRQVLVPSEPTDLALSLRHLGDLQTLRAANPEAENAYRRAISLQKSLPPDKRDNLALACSLYGLGNELENAGRFAEAERTLRDALTLQQRLYTDTSVDCQGSQGHAKADIARTMQVLAWTINERDLNEAIPLMKSAVAIQRSVWGTEPYPDYADELNDLGLLLRYQGDYDGSEQLLRESQAMYRRLLGDKHPEIAMSLHNLALVLELKGDLGGANSSFRQALAMRRELLGDAHPDVAQTLSELARVIDSQGDVRGAIDAERESLDIYRKLFPGDNPDVARTMNVLGYFLMESGDYSTAETYLQGGLQMRRRLFGDAHPEIASSLVGVAILQVGMHKYSDALASARAAGDMYTSALSASNWKTALAESVGGAALAGMGEYPEAEERLLHGYAVLSNNAAALPMYRKLARHYLETLYRSWGRPSDAMRYAAATDSSAGVRAAQRSTAGGS